MTLPTNFHALTKIFSLNTASLALFRVLTAIAIFWHLIVNQGLLVTLILLLPVLALALGYRTRLISMGLLIVAILFTLANWGTLSIHDLWMALLCSWCASLPVNAQWGVDAALQHCLKENPNAGANPHTNPDAKPDLSPDTSPDTNSSQHLMPRTHTHHSGFTLLIGLLVLALTLLNLFVSTMGINLFNVAALSLLIPASLWQTFINTKKASPQYQNIQKLIIHYDADCGFCLKMCLVLREFLLTRETKIITAQSDEKIFAIMDANNSWVIQSADGKTHIHWHAMQHLFAQRMPFKLIARIMNLPPLMRMGNKVYAWVAVNRATMGRITATGLPWVNTLQAPTRATATWVAAISIALAIALTVLQVTAAVL